MTKTTKTLINKMHWPVNLKKVIEYSNSTSLLSKSQSLMSVILTIKANNENSQQLIPLAVTGRVKEKRKKKLWESEWDISFHISFSFFVDGYFYYCTDKDFFFSKEAIVRRGWNTTFDVKMWDLNQPPERTQRSLLARKQKCNKHRLKVGRNIS